MARPASLRAPAEPRSQGQKDRIDRVLRTAAELVAVSGLDGLQMTDVARQAGVSTATLYRYLPSKTHLMVAIQVRQVQTFAAQALELAGRVDTPEEKVASALLMAARNLLRRPALGLALVLSSNIANPVTVPDVGRIDSTFRDLMLRLLDIDDPTQRDITAVRLLSQVWHGIVLAALNGRMSTSDAEADIRTATHVLLAIRSPKP